MPEEAEGPPIIGSQRGANSRRHQPLVPADVTESLWEAAARPQLWVQAIADLAHFCEASEALLLRVTRNDGRAEPLAWNGANNSLAAAFCNTDHTDLMGLIGEAAETPVGSAWGLDEPVPIEDPHGGTETACGIALRDDSHLLLVFLRQPRKSRKFNRQQLARLCAALPLIGSAMHLQRRLARTSDWQAAATAMLDLIRLTLLVVDSRLHILYRNRKAAKEIPNGARLKLLNGRDLARRPTENPSAKVSATRAQEGATGLMAIEIMPGRERQALILPLEKQYVGARDGEPLFLLVLFEELLRGNERTILRDAFGLTAAEERVAMAVGTGEQIDKIAARTGVSLTTIRTHLSHVYVKTGTRRQAELAHLVTLLTIFQPE